jgi:hypothetical protein
MYKQSTDGQTKCSDQVIRKFLEEISLSLHFVWPCLHNSLYKTYTICSYLRATLNDSWAVIAIEAGATVAVSFVAYLAYSGFKQGSKRQ